MAHRPAGAAELAAEFEAVVGPWVEEMYRAAAAIVGVEDARDVTQDALVDAWRGFGALRDRGRTRAWLHKIVANRCRKHFRTQRTRPAVANSDPPEVAGADEIGPLAERDRLDRAFAALTPDQRVAVVLHYVLDLSVPAVAAAVSAREGTVKSRIHSGIERLRAVLEMEEHG